MKLNIIGANEQILKGVNELTELLDISLCQCGILVKVYKTDKGLSIEKNGDGYAIGYNRTVEFYRALGILTEALKKESSINVNQVPSFEMNGLMLDCSRNAVPKVSTIKRMIRYMALMGLSSLQLYTEDTFEVKEYPYFGYMRGRFTADEIMECDNYAKLFGIEMIPCVQTLAHFNQAMRWKFMAEMTDYDDILLAGDEKTYKFLDAMIGSLASMFTSRRINIGMDEAHMVGLGNYLIKNGYQNRFEIMTKHLGRVLEICKKYGFKPMMWSDMFFRLAFKGEYYVEGSIPEKVLNAIPPEVSMVYWDYYSEKNEIYDSMIKAHQKFRNPLLFAGGAWKWMGFAPALEYSLKVGRLATASCLKNGVKEVFVTAWGDNGAECSCYSILPILQLYAEVDYGADTSDTALAERFKTCTDGVFEDFLQMDTINTLPGNPTPGECGVNPSKYLLFQDLLMGMFDKHMDEGVYNSCFRESARKLEECAYRNPQFSGMFNALSKLAGVLELKCDMGIRLAKAYKGNDRKSLKQISEVEIPILYERVSEFHRVFESQWMSENKAIGFDVQDLRLGGLLMRLKSAQKRVSGYLCGELEALEELEQERLYFDARESAGDRPHISENRWQRIVSAGII